MRSRRDHRARQQKNARQKLPRNGRQPRAGGRERARTILNWAPGLIDHQQVVSHLFMTLQTLQAAEKIVAAKTGPFDLGTTTWASMLTVDGLARGRGALPYRR